MSKRLIALLLALVLCVGMLAACGGDNDDTTAGKDDTTAGKTDDTTADQGYVTPNFNGEKITYYVVNNKDYDPEGSYAEKLISSHLNLDLNVIEIQGEEISQLLLQGKAPELQYVNSFTNSSFQNIIDGAYINVYDYLDQMPNVKAWIEKPENAVHLEKFISGNGDILGGIPVIQVGGNAAKYAFLYRQDIFEKNNLTWPTNQAEFEKTLRDLKAIYPDSMPFTMRQFKGNFQGAEAFGQLWGGAHLLKGYFGTYFTLNDEGEFYWGTTSQPYKEMAQWFVDMTAEGLFNPVSWTAGNGEWYTALSTVSFITYDKVDRLPTLNGEIGKVDASYKLIAGAPFNMGTHATETDKVATGWSGYATGYALMIGNTDNLDNVLKFVDWLYSDEAYLMTNWGKEGESYVVNADGTKSFKEGFLESFGANGLVLSGLWSTQLSGRTDFEAYLASCDEQLRKDIETAIPTEAGGELQHYLKFIGSEEDTMTTYGAPMYTYALGEFAKFCTGQRPMSE